MIDPSIIQYCLIAFNRAKHRGAAEVLRTLKRYGSLARYKRRPPQGG